jgi:hypothetical protein
MATDTPNFNWPIPEDTDLVKDGAKAIRDLGNAIDTSAQDFGGGLVHIETRTVTASSSEIFNNVFSSTYDNYKVIFHSVITTSNQIVNLRLRVGGVDTAGGNYFWGQHRALANGTGSNAGGNGTSSFRLGEAVTGTHRQTIAEIQNPNKTIVTGFSSLGFDVNAGFFIGGALLDSTAYDGFSILPAANQITGTVTIYGYAKA